MRVEYINSFIEATTIVLKAMTNVDFLVGKPYLAVNSNPDKYVFIMVGITGEIKGKATIGMDMNAARSIASAMMMGFPVEELDDMSKSALGELGNMIMGNTATLIYELGHKIDITIPTLIVGKNISMLTSGMKTIGIPVESSIGKLTLSIASNE